MWTGGRTGAPVDVENVRARRRDRMQVACDLLAVVAALVVVGFGLANLRAVGGAGLAVRQAAIAVAGIALLAALWRFRLRMLIVLGWITYGLALALLLAVEVAGETTKGATRWLDVGGVTFQPSELAKLGLLLTLAAVLGSARPAWHRVVLALGLAVPVIGLVLRQPDLSTTALLVGLTAAMLVIGRAPARLLLPLLAAAAVAAPLVIGLLRPYQVERLGSFLVGAHESPTGAGWAVQQARIALGAGTLFGRSGEPLTDLMAQYLPERDTDLALASVVEQYGLVAGGAVLLAALVLVWRLALAARLLRAPQGALVAAGLAVLLGIEVVVSAGGNLGLLPLAGVPFPLLSYGGTALLVHLVALGVALGVRRDGARRRLWTVPRLRTRRPRLVRVTALGLTALLAAFGTYGWNLQAAHGDALLAAGHDQMTRCIRLPAPRGTITDRHGAPLALNAADTPAGVDRVLVVPTLLLAEPDGVSRLAGLTGQPADTLRTAVESAPATAVSLPVADVPRAAGDAVAAAGITGVVVVPEPRRQYPTGPLLGPLLGFTGIATPADTQRWPALRSGAIVGRAGVEQQYDAVLRGIDGRQCVYVTPAGVPARLGPRVEPVRGADLRLSLDLGLQQRLTADLGTALRAQRNRASVGAAVAMDPRTGQVLALASQPSYDNNLYGPPVDAAALRAAASAPGHPMTEHATQAALPPGSTFKLVVAAAAVADPVIPPQRAIPTGASFTYGGHTFGNWRPMGPMNLPQSIAWSNDVYFYRLAVALGPDRIIAAARALGVGARTGIDLPGESPGLLATPESVRARGGTWYGGSTVILGIGQGLLQTTPLQNARWTAAVATGRLVTPRLGLATGASAGGFSALPAPEPAPLPFADALGPVRAGMRAAVSGGTATALAEMPVPAAGKTGTAQDGSLPAGSYDNWLSAVAPADAPRITVTAVVQGPGSGANSAKPVVAAALRHYLDHEAEVLATDPLPAPG